MTLNRIRQHKWLALLLGSFFITNSAFAAVTTPVVTSYPVVASSSPVTVSGTGTIGNSITLTGGSATSTATVDGSGSWSASVGLNPNALNNLSIFADDGMGSTSSSTMISILYDNTDPVFASTTDVTATASTSAGAIVNFALPLVTDNLSATTTVTCVPASGGLFAVGTTTVTCTAVDDAGNTATTTLLVIVSAVSTTTVATTTPITIITPTITLGQFCGTSSPLTINGNAEANANITVTGGASTATTTANGSGAFSLSVPLNANSLNQLVIQSALGTSTASTTFGVTLDSTPPVITVNQGNIVISQNGTFTDPGVTVSDNLDTSVTASTTGSVNTGVAGTYTITYTATDCAGNTAIAERTVTVTAQPSGGGSSSGRRNSTPTATGGVTGGSVTDTNVYQAPFTPQVLGLSNFLIPGLPNTGSGGMAGTNWALLLGALAITGVGLYLTLRRKESR